MRKQTTFLLGSRYVILDRIFARERMRSRRGTESLRKVLVCFGGSDPTNNTMRVLKGLELVREALAIHVVLGEANTHDDTIREFCDSMTASVTVEKGMDSLCSAMSDTGLAFCSVGNTSYELACLGVPSLLVIAKHEHESNAQALDRAGCIVLSAWESPYRLRQSQSPSNNCTETVMHAGICRVRADNW